MNLITALGMLSAGFVAWFTCRAYFGADDGKGAQSRRASIVEAWTNIVIGFSINFAANLLLIPLMTDGHAVTVASNWWGGWVYTAISILRQYVIRRWFNTQSFADWIARRLA